MCSDVVWGGLVCFGVFHDPSSVSIRQEKKS